MQKKLIAVIIAIVILVAAVGAALILTSKAPESVGYVSMPVPSMKGALSTNSSIGGYIAWEPFDSDGVISGVGHVLNWSGDIRPNHVCCVILVSDAFLETPQGPNLTIRFLKAHVEATEWMNSALADNSSANYTLLVSMAVNFTGKNSTVIEAAFEHMKFETAITQQAVDDISWYAQQFIEIEQMTNTSLNNRGYSSPDDFASKYINASYLTDAVSVTPNSTIIGNVSLGFLTGDLHQLAQYVARNTSVFGSDSLFEQYGVDVDVAVGAPYASGPAEMENFANGNVDIGYLGAPPAILKHINSPMVNAKIVALVNTEGSALVVAPGINSLNDLRGKVVAVPGVGSIQYLLLQVIMREAGIPLVAA